MLPLFEDLYMLRSTLETRHLFLILDPVLLLLNFLSKAYPIFFIAHNLKN